MNLDLTLISMFLTTSVALLGFIWMIFTTRQMKNKISEYEPDIQNITSLFRYEEGEDGKPMLDVRLVKIAEAFSSGVAKSIQASVMGQLSGVARMEKGLKGAIANDIVDQKMPIMSLIGDFMGINTKKYITKHPEAMGQILQMAQPYLQKLMQGRNNGGGRSSSGVPEMR